MKYLLPVLALFITIAVSGQQAGKASVTGVIKDTDGQPVPFVNVLIEGTTLGSSTNELGQFNISHVAAGEITLIVSSIGFEDYKQKVTVGNQGKTFVEISLTQSSKELGEVVVLGQRRITSSATKTNVEIMDIPMAIQVIGQDVIQQQAVIDMKDIVRNVSGMNQTGSYNGGYQYFNSRGFDMNNWTNFRRNGTLLWNMGNHYADFYESVEFLKGPSAILFGDVAPGGIMNFVTKKPLNYDYKRFELKVGQYGLFRPTFDISGPLNEKKNVLYRLNATYEKSQSFRDVVENETVMLASAIQWRISDKTSWLVEGNLKEDQRVGDPGLVSPDGTFEGLGRISERTFLGEREATYTYNNTSLFSTFKHYFSDQWSLQNLISYTGTVRTPLNIYVNNDADAAGNVTRYQYFFKQRFDTWTTSLDLVGDLNTGAINHKILVGADFVDDEIRLGGFNEQTIPGTINLYNPQYGQEPLEFLSQVWDPYANFTSRFGLYVQDQLSLMKDKLQVLVGLRYNRYVSGTRYDNAADEPDDNALVKENPLIPRVGIVYKPQPWMSVYGSYAESYEVNGFDWIQVDYLVPPTYGKQLEFGVKGDFLDEKLGLTLAVFNINKLNAYSWAYSDTPPAFEYISWTPDYGGYFTYLAPKQQSRGIELDVNGRITKDLKITGAASYIVAQVVEDPGFPTGNWLPNQPRYMGNLWIAYNLPKALKGVDIGYGIFYRGSFYADLENDPLNQAQSSYTMDVALGYSFKNFRTQLNVSNITNEINYLGAYGVWEPQWTRRAILSIAYKF
jgi:iron complex outermembrane receptor protein